MTKVTAMVGVLGLGLVAVAGTAANAFGELRGDRGDASQAAGGDAPDRFVLDGDPAIHALAGEIEVVPGSGDRVEVTVDFMGADADRLSVDIEEIRGRQALVVRFPDDRIVFDRGSSGRYETTVRVEEDGTWDGGRTGWSGADPVRIASSGSGLEAWVSVRVEVPRGRDVEAFVGAGSIRAHDAVSDVRLNVSAGSINVERHEGGVWADTGSGDIRLAGIAGTVNADTGSGDIVVEAVRGESVRLDTGSGDIRAVDVRSGDLSADTGSGDIDLARLDGREVLVDTGSGDVEIGLSGTPATLDVDTGSGDVTVRFGSDVDARFDIDTGSGGIEVGLPGVRTSRSERGEFSGIVGQGRGSVVIDTGSGRVRLLASTAGDQRLF